MAILAPFDRLLLCRGWNGEGLRGEIFPAFASAVSLEISVLSFSLDFASLFTRGADFAGGSAVSGPFLPMADVAQTQQTKDTTTPSDNNLLIIFSSTEIFFVFESTRGMEFFASQSTQRDSQLVFLMP
jgi:hypothetical protein